MRTWLAGGMLALAVGVVAPDGARAQDVHGQVSFLARMAIDLTVDRLTLEDEFLIRLPAPEEPASERKVVLDVGGTSGVVDLLGPGLDVSSPEEAARSVVLQLRPNFGRRGGLLRATFRF